MFQIYLESANTDADLDCIHSFLVGPGDAGKAGDEHHTLHFVTK